MTRWRASLSPILVIGVLVLRPVSASASARLSVTPELQLSDLYDDNLLLASKAGTADLVGQALFDLRINADSARTTASIEYGTTAQKYAFHPEFGAVFNTHSLALSGERLISRRTRASFQDSFFLGNGNTALIGSDTPWLSPQLAQAVLLGRRSLSNEFNFRLDYDVTSRWVFTSSFRQSFLSAAFGNSYMQGAGLDAAYRLTPALRVGGSYDFADFRFGNGAPSADTHFAGISVQWEASPGLLSNLSSGVIAGESAGLRPGYGGALAYANGRWTLRIAAAQTPGITAGLGSAGVNRTSSGRVRYSISESTYIAFGVGYYQFVGGGTNARLIGYGGGLTHRVAPWLAVYARYFAVRRIAGRVNPAILSTQPSVSVQTGPAASNSYLVGARVSFEALREAL
jgi:hypothetical protein